MGEIQKIVDSVRLGKSSALEQVETALKLAKQNQDYNALINLTEKRAIERAKLVDGEASAGKSQGRLCGVPFVAKDNFLSFGAPTTAGSKILENFKAPYQATVVEKLEAEGAICIGKTNMDAFGHGASTENSAFGPTKNAHDTTRVAGGSSGGSAVAVALGIVPFALGTDTGGSIRQPSSFNGVVGMKPSYGAVSRYGVIAMASSTDTIGAITKTAADNELILDVISGQDKKDSNTLNDFFKPLPQSSPKRKIGVIKEFMGKGIAVDPSVRELVSNYVSKLSKAGHDVEEVSLPLLKYSLPAYYIIVPAEVSSNLARYDGIKYGYRAADAKNLHEVYGYSRDQGFMPENKRRIMIGSYVLSSGFFDDYYLQAQKARTLLIRQFAEVFQKYDVLLGPTASTPAFKLGAKTDDPLQMYLADIMTVAASLAGLPALSVPAGVAKDSLPVGAQLIGPYKKDAELLALARSIEETE